MKVEDEGQFIPRGRKTMPGAVSMEGLPALSGMPTGKALAQSRGPMKTLRRLDVAPPSPSR